MCIQNIYMQKLYLKVSKKLYRYFQVGIKMLNVYIYLVTLIYNIIIRAIMRVIIDLSYTLS